MPNAISVITGLLLFAQAGFNACADSTWEYSVQVSATAQESPAQITLIWPQDTFGAPLSHTIYRKAPGATSWGVGITLPGNTTTYVDSDVGLGTAYEYQIIKRAAFYTGYGYICAGVGVPMMETRGKLVLVVDNTYAAQLASELTRLQQDLIGDGWTVVQVDVNRTDPVTAVKNLIKTEYAKDPANVKSVFLFGHVPVPYSGDIVPDGHAPDHQGAWPCDAYYGDMDGTWTDNAVNDPSASDPRNRNVPGDGKFDQSSLPAPLKLMVGRVDLANMPGRHTWGGAPTFPSELELLRNYLNKDHKFRQKEFDLPRRAILGDFFGDRNGEAFVASAWRNFSSFFGAANLSKVLNQGDWVPTLNKTAALTAYGCGAGTYTSMGGLGNSGIYHDAMTTEVVSNDLKAAFILVFGSWLGDWDSEDNLMRSVLALPSYGLASAWSGRPHWFLHHMALGETIGFGARLTQNNGPGGLYKNQVNSCAGQTHIALMGDPTLRLHTVAPPKNLSASISGTNTVLSWKASADSVAGYYVYGAPTVNGPFTRQTSLLVTGTTTSVPISADSQIYMVRAVKLETSGSGTYWNGSQGAFAVLGTAITSGPTTSNPDPTTL